MKVLVVKFFLVAAFAACGSAHAVTCNVTATSVPLSTLYATGTATEVTGTISVTCTKQTGDPAGKPDIYIGINQGAPPAGRTMTRQNGTQTLTYEIYHKNYGSGIWNEASGIKPPSNNDGGVVYKMDNTTVAQNFPLPYYLRIPTPQTFAPAGIYDDLAVSVTVRLSTDTGAILAATSFGVSANIQHSCYFSSAPAPLSMNYTSFTSTPATGNAAFQLSCTYNSPYTLTIGPPVTGTLLGLNYSLALSAPSGTGTGGPQSFSVNGTVASGQSGTCATSSCSASQAHTITVGF